MATPVFCVLVDEGSGITCPVCLELLHDPSAPQLLNFPHVCCNLCIQKMRIVCRSNRIIDCPDCCHISRKAEELDGCVHHGRAGDIRSGKLSDGAKHDLKNIDTCYYHTDLPNITHNEIDKRSNHKAGEFYCVLVEEDLPCPTCHDSKKELYGCNSCKGDQQHLCNDENFLAHMLKNTDTASGEKKINKDKEAKEVDEHKQSEQNLAALQTEIEKHLENQQKLIAKQAEHAINMIHKERKRMIVNLRENVQSKVDAIKHERQDLMTQIRNFERAIAASDELGSQSTASAAECKCHEQMGGELLPRNNNEVKRTNHVLGMTKFIYGFDMAATFGSLSQIKELKCELVQEFGVFQLAGFVTTAPNGLLVVSDCSSNEVLVYKKDNTGHYENEPFLCLTTKSTARTDGVAVTTEGKYLVAKFRDIDVYSQSGKYEGALNFRHESRPGSDRKYATAIEVMHDGKIIVGDSYNSTLTIISKDLTILRKIHTSTKPVRIASRLNGVIASYWRENKICMIDIESGLKVQTFDIPHSSAVCYHKETDSLLVGRCLNMAANTMPTTGSGIIEQYCASTGKFVGRIAEGLFLPRDFAFTSDGVLAVADTRTVKLFNVE